MKLGAVGLVSGLAGCSSVRSSRSTGGSELQSQLDEVRAATEQYASPRTAVQDGFRITGPVAPGQGWHFVNTERVRAAAKEGLSRSKPQVLTYDTEMNLVAVEWAVPAGAVSETPDLFADENADATEEWHTHESFTHVLATGNGRRDDPKQLSFDAFATNENWAAFRPPDTDLAPGDEIALKWGVDSADADQGDETRVADLVATHPRLETLHVWVHSENPKGVFHPSHPDVAGGGRHHS